MKDFTGKELAVGDTVIFVAPGYRHLVRATVMKFTPKKVLIQYINDWNYGKPGREDTFLQEPHQLVKL